MRSTFKVLFYVKKGSEKPNGNLPLMCRITVDGEIKQFSCKMDVPLRLWDVKNNRASGKSAEAQRINRAVDKIRVEINRRYQELMQTDGYVTAAKLKDAYLGIGIKQETLLKLFEQHNSEFAKKVGHSRAKGTFRRYVTVCKHIREFLPHTYKREDIPLKELNLSFINDFEYFLRTEKKCRTNTIWGYMIVLKHIISIARNDGRLPFNPFAGYINSPESVDRLVVIWVVTKPEICHQRMIDRNSVRDTWKLEHWDEYVKTIDYSIPEALKKMSSCLDLMLFYNSSDEEYQKSMEMVISRLEDE